DVGAPAGERRQAMALDEARTLDHSRQARQGRIEALEMSDLEDAAMRARDPDQGRGLRGAGRERLLDQTVDAGAEEQGADLAVMDGRYDDARTVDRADEIAVVRDGAAAEPRRQRLRPAEVDIGDRDQLAVRRLRVLLGVERAQVARSDDPRAHRATRSPWPPSAWVSTATTAIPAASAASISRARSRSSVRPASTASAVARTAAMSRTVSTPIAGTSKRRSCPGLATLTTT